MTVQHPVLAPEWTPAPLVVARADTRCCAIIRHDKFKDIGALERIDAAGAQLAHGVKIGCDGQPLLLGHAARHAQLPPCQPLLADRVHVPFGGDSRGAVHLTAARGWLIVGLLRIVTRSSAIGGGAT